MAAAPVDLWHGHGCEYIVFGRPARLPVAGRRTGSGWIPPESHGAKPRLGGRW